MVSERPGRKRRAPQRTPTWIFLLLFGTVHAPSFSQQNIRFRSIAGGQGLSQSSVYAIAQDRQGFMWFGTEEGANRYDGYGMRVFRPERGDPASLSGNWIYCLMEDRQGRIWFGTINGLSVFDRETEKFRRFNADPERSDALISDQVYALREDAERNLWIGTDLGLHRLDADRAVITRFLVMETDPEGTAANDIRAILQARDGSLWVGTFGGGIRRRDAKSGEWTRYLHRPNEPAGLRNNYVTSLIQDREGVIWIGTRAGLDRFDPAGGFVRDPKDPSRAFGPIRDWVTCLFEDADGDLWIGTYNEGLYIRNKAAESFIRYIHHPEDPSSLGADRILSIHQDRSGLMWIGTYAGSINICQKNAARFQHTRRNPLDPLSISQNTLRAFLEDGPDRLFLGTESAGINLIDRQKGRTIVLDHDPGDPSSLSDNQVYALVKDKAGTIWAGTMGGGLNRYDPATRTFTRYRHRPDDPRSLGHDSVRALCPSRDGGLWIGSFEGGLSYFDPETGRFSRFRAEPQNPNSLALNRIYALAEDPRTGILWIGTFGAGLDRFDPATGVFRHYRSVPDNPASLGNDFVVCVHIDMWGILWIGTGGGGLTRFDPAQETFKTFTQEDGLPNNIVYGILEDEEGNLWMSTNQGLSKFDPRRSKFKNFDLSDGLQGMEFDGGSYHRGESGLMYFGGINGYNVFRPENIVDNPYVPPVVITGIQVFNRDIQVGERVRNHLILTKSINTTEALTLTFQNRVVAFEFAALSFQAPEKNQYAYKMEGFDDDWNMVGTRRFASYTNLPPRRYRFIVKASNNDGLWNEAGTVLSINVVPPFWQAWWFKILAVLLIALGIRVVYGLRMKVDVKKRKELESLVQQRTKELNEAYREMERLSITDALTGLYNRRFFISRVDNDIALVLRQKERREEKRGVSGLGFLMIDLDHFKAVNDRYGHDIGDLILKEFAQRFTSKVRSHDVTVRWGGEEFLLMAKEADFECTKRLAQRLLKTVRQEPFHPGDLSIRMTISIGYCLFPLFRENKLVFSWEETIKLADQALYLAKQSGRNRIVGLSVETEKLDLSEIELIKTDFTLAREKHFLEDVTIFADD